MLLGPYCMIIKIIRLKVDVPFVKSVTLSAFHLFAVEERLRIDFSMLFCSSKRELISRVFRSNKIY